jgi:hypothetical protein
MQGKKEQIGDLPSKARDGGAYTLLLEEFLGEVFQVSTTELGANGNNNDLPTIPRNNNRIA